MAKEKQEENKLTAAWGRSIRKMCSDWIAMLPAKTLDFANLQKLRRNTYRISIKDRRELLNRLLQEWWLEVWCPTSFDSFSNTAFVRRTDTSQHIRISVIAQQHWSSAATSWGFWTFARNKNSGVISDADTLTSSCWVDCGFGLRGKSTYDNTGSETPRNRRVKYWIVFNRNHDNPAYYGKAFMHVIYGSCWLIHH